MTKKLVLIILLLSASLALGQALAQFATIEPHQYDSLNLATLGIQLSIPVRNKAGHIPFQFSLTGASQIVVVTMINPPPIGTQNDFFSVSSLEGRESHFGPSLTFQNQPTQTCNSESKQ
jgi:hypothetical protein